MLQFFENSLKYLYIDDVSITKGTTSFNISPTLIPSGATVNYELIRKPEGVTIDGTTINIAANVNAGEYSITVKATGTGDYNGEIGATFKLNITLIPLEELSIDDVSVARGDTSFDISPTLIPSGATAHYSLIDPPGVTIDGITVSIPADMGIGEYNIAVKATGTENYTGEIGATFKLKLFRMD